MKYSVKSRRKPRQSNKSRDFKNEVVIRVAKWVTAFIIYGAVLSCVVTSKICLLVLGQQFKSIDETTTNSTTKYSSETNKQALFLMLVLVLMIPEAVCFIITCWTSLLEKDRPWPSKQASIFTLIGGFLEACCLCYIAVVMVTVLPVSPDSIVSLMCSVSGLSLLWQEVYKFLWQRETPISKRVIVASLLSTVLVFAGTIILSFKVTDRTGQICSQAAFYLLSIVWSPKFREVQIQGNYAKGVCFEQYLLTYRRNRQSEKEHSTQQNLQREDSQMHVFICTTMYLEKDKEMEELLRSIIDVNKNLQNSRHRYESHVFFDGCVDKDRLNSHVLRLVYLVKEFLNLPLNSCIKMRTPYGMQLKWTVRDKMEFTIHLKDSTKVKRKKRWSQVMYMSYILDYKIPEGKDDQCFILSTDGDVKFTYESVETLIDRICEDTTVDAVCARTHPLGRGPIVWYQIFDYAIGHWFQKVTNHMLGTVLCCPGCFSLYRCEALRDVLKEFATPAKGPFEYLSKDLGEDRWLCTLMIQSGKRLTYCATANNSTYCPESFEEFYKQRRRWTLSSLANLVLLISKGREILRNNKHVSFLFILYQTFVVIFSVIGSSTLILVIAGGMTLSGVPIKEIYAVGFLCLVFVAYVLLCLYKPKWQLKVSKMLTFLFSAIMCIIVIGMASQVSKDLQARKVDPTVGTIVYTNTSLPAPKLLQHNLLAAVSSLYLAGLIGVFAIASFLHPGEILCSVCGIWYILCLPSGFLLLTIYSICNLTDTSWGTREGDYSGCPCLCLQRSHQIRPDQDEKESKGPDLSGLNRKTKSPKGITTTLDTIQMSPPEKEHIHTPVKNYLQDKELGKYATGFVENGYELMMDLAGLQEEDLKEVGVEEADTAELLQHIKKIPLVKISDDIPGNVRDWLVEYRLEEYWHVFESKACTDPEALQDLKMKSERNPRQYLKEKFEIEKPGHLKRLIEALHSLLPSPEMKKISFTSCDLDRVPFVEWEDYDEMRKENIYWEGLLPICLTPDDKSYESTTFGQKKLRNLRMTVLWVFGTLVGGFFEASSLCYITVVMVTTLPVSPDFLVVLMCSIAGLPLMLQKVYRKKCQSGQREQRDQRDQLSVWDIMISLVSTLFFFAGNIMLSLKVADLKGIILAELSLFLLSIVWSPTFRKLQIKNEHQEEKRETKREKSTEMAEECVDTLQKPGISSKKAFVAKPVCEEMLSRISNSSEGSLQSETGPPWLTRTAQAKTAVISSLCKLLFIPVMAVAFSSVYGIVKFNTFDGFKAITMSNPSCLYFIFHILASFFGYHFGWIACSLRVQRVGLALPLTLATPIAVIITQFIGFCETETIPSSCTSGDIHYVLGAGLLLWLAQCLGTTYNLFKSPGKILGKVYDSFWIPCYNGVCLEQYLLTNKRNLSFDEECSSQENASASNQKDRGLHVFICTTMYHEKRKEMKQLLESVYDVLKNNKSGHHFEAHVFFDGCLRAEELNSYVLQLASLVKNTLKVKELSDCIKVETHFGMQLKWKLELERETSFTIHLKDNAKVKNKKRWSQVMYMSYVLDFKIVTKKLEDDQCFILATDGDVKFTHESVEALIDQMCEDSRTGAVCARTYPLGEGPVYWYQIFDYAIGHWFQKVTNHMLGSVLCCPGCFSLYRCRAVRDVLPNYATCADTAFQCLTKDMGEDRWMCTLMIQNGWRLTYCAAAENSTFCPESFQEFYKQRRRWAPSTLANLFLLIREWKQTWSNNEHISLLFFVYQAFLFFSTIIGGSTVILVIVGGIVLAGVPISQITTSVLLILVVVGYVLVCLYTTPKWQLRVSKILTCFFSVIMCTVVVGLAVQVSNDLKERKVEPSVATTMQTETTSSTTTTTTKPLEHHLPVGVSSLYLGGLTGIFVVSALLHPREVTCLFHGIGYFFCLPSGYLLLTVYAICNLTDSSWGTREESSTFSGKKSSQNSLWEYYLCCHWTRSDGGGDETKKLSDSKVAGPSGLNTNAGSAEQERMEGNATITPVEEIRSSEAKGKTPRTKATYPPKSYDERILGKQLKDFLSEIKLEKYCKRFLDNGYEFPDDLVGIKEKDLEQIEINEGDRSELLEYIKRIPTPKTKHKMPENIKGWLKKHHLEQYHSEFAEVFEHPCQLLKLKNEPEKDFKESARKKFGIEKPGHFKRLLKAVYSLQVKGHAQMTVLSTEHTLNSVLPVQSDNEDYPEDEITFWKELLEQGFLSPIDEALASTSSAEEDLRKLRTTTLWVFGVCNMIWMVLILTLVQKADLKILGLDVIALSFLIIYGGIFVAQFLALLCHRVKTIMHILARTPWTVQKKNGKSVLQSRKHRRLHPA